MSITQCYFSFRVLGVRVTPLYRASLVNVNKLEKINLILPKNHDEQSCFFGGGGGGKSGLAGQCRSYDHNLLPFSD